MAEGTNPPEHGRRAGARGEGPWFPFVRPRPQAAWRLFCLPFAGGGASVFRTLAQDLAPAVDAWAVQLPGRETRLREPPRADMTTLVDELLPVLAENLERPFALFGYSLGAMVAFELARRLSRSGGPQPAHLFACAAGSPHTPPRHPLHALPEEQFLEELRRLDGTPPRVLEDPELMELFLPMLRADMTLSETYFHAPDDPLDLPITVFGGLQDTVSRRRLEAWEQHTRGPFELRLFPGGHFFLNGSRGQVVQAIQQALGVTPRE